MSRGDSFLPIYMGIPEIIQAVSRDGPPLGNGSCPCVTPFVLARKFRAPSAREPHTVPPLSFAPGFIGWRTGRIRGMSGESRPLPMNRFMHQKIWG